jgi:hypothetical protein
MEIAGIGIGEKHMLFFFLTPTPTRYQKWVQNELTRKKSKQALGFNE